MRSRRLAARPVVLTLAALPFFAQQITFRARIEVVRVDASVTLSGEHVGGLTVENFEVSDNDVKQKISSATLERVPLDVYLVLDMSGSVAGLRLHELRRAASALVDELQAPDRVALLTFSKTVTVRQELTSNFQTFKYALLDLTPGGDTALYDAIARAIALREPRDSRAIVVVCADDHDNASTVSRSQVALAAQRSDVTVYGVTAPDYQGTALSDGRVGFRYGAQIQLGFLAWLTGSTGGRLFHSGTGLPLKDLFGLVLRDARSRYVTYSPEKTTPGWHKLDVKLVGAKGDVVARRGYFVGTSAGGK